MHLDSTNYEMCFSAPGTEFVNIEGSSSSEMMQEKYILVLYRYMHNNYNYACKQ